MGGGVEAISVEVTGVAAEVGTVAELGAEVSRQLGRAVPHDGYMLTGLDPLTRGMCLYTRRHGYGSPAARRLLSDDRLKADAFSYESLATGPCRVGVIDARAARHRHSGWVNEVMAGEGVGSELRIALADGRSLWGALALLRGTGGRPFSAAEAACAERLTGALVGSLRRFVTGRPLQSFRLERPPGIVVVRPDGTSASATESASEWGAEFTGGPAHACAGEFQSLLWATAYLAPRIGGTALTRVPLAGGWAALQAQPLRGAGPDAMAVTVRPTTGTELLPAMAAWHGLTPREQAVVETALEGMSAKQIARRLGVSPYTVNDHLKAIYRKTGVSAREELIARLAR
ncbi:helix-turn-helix transcriptional regulator [Actinomadura rubrisoli]|uniref:LuxR family transcriptional regulator n=1 Tax=Actinomadura rubrisoli TaxID=2530368 RepID=A0A4R5CGJ4_9ACTN|nr:helix-turn-helix transcriptional regulator [Actinomadura rubrisoli]TDD98179.1 LuxR family transcriptional regulator [Actinomadura rubrisoli]